MSKCPKILGTAFLLQIVLASVSLSQDIVPMENGSRGLCASSAVNDPTLIRQAWVNTMQQRPGLVEAVQRLSLEKGSLDLKVGDQNLFWVYNIDKKVFDTVRAELKVVGTISYVWVALAEWNNGHVTSVEIAAVTNALEHSTSRTSLDSTKGILQIDRQVYGDPPNINSNFQKGGGDGRTHFLLCDIQDGWNGSGSFVAGFFYNVDVDPNTSAVNTSNRRDMLYIDTYPGIYFTGVRRTSTALATLAHEFQHLIHWNYDSSELTFFNEGLSEYAENLCGFTLRSPSGYFGNTNVTLTGWNNTVEDYSRAALWTRFVAEQYGLSFLRNFVQNPAHGIAALELSLQQTGYPTTFNATAINFFAANWLGSGGSDASMRYKSSLGLRPVLRSDYVDPTVQRSDTLFQQGVQYISFASSKNFHITFTLPAGMTVRAIESGPTTIRVRDVPGSVEFTSPELGTQFTSVVFVIANMQTALFATCSYAAGGDLSQFIAEESYDSGTPHAFSTGFSPYLGFGNNSSTLGMAVRFQPQVNRNILRKARMMVAFNQEFNNGTALSSDPRNFAFHVWGDGNGRPGADIIQPFLVSVDRNLYPMGGFFDIDLSAYESALTNLKGPVYLGFMEDVNDSVGTYLAVDNFVTGDYSYVYRGPKYTRIPNTWETMQEVSAVNNHQLDGFNLMVRAVFEYSDSSSAPAITLGYLQNPLLSEYIDVVAASPSDLRLNSLSGTVTQSAGSSTLRFYSIPGTSRAFIDSTLQLKGNGTVSVHVRGAKKFGVYYTDTTATFNARLLKPGESSTVSTPSGALSASFDPDAVPQALYVTAVDGSGNPQSSAASSGAASHVFSIGPSDYKLRLPARLRITGAMLDESTTLAQYRNGKWLSVPSSIDKSSGNLMASVMRLGTFGIVKRIDVDGKADAVPTEFALHQNYPNPFNPSTAISYQLPALSGGEGSAVSTVSLRVFDLLGREVAILIDGVGEPGLHTVTWNGKNKQGESVSSGIYYYQLQARLIQDAQTGISTLTRKMVLLK